MMPQPLPTLRTTPPPLVPPPPTSPTTPTTPPQTTAATTPGTATILQLLETVPGRLRGRPLSSFAFLRHAYGDDDEDMEAAMESIIAETTFMQPNIATTKVYSDHEINYTTTTRSPETTNNNTQHQHDTTTSTAIITPETEVFVEPIRETSIGSTGATAVKKQQPQQTPSHQEQHLYHTL